MSEQGIKAVLDRAGAAVNRGDIDGVLECFTDDAVLVIHEDQLVKGKSEIRTTLELIDAYFSHTLHISQSDVRVLAEGDTALVTALTTLRAHMADGYAHCEQRTSTYIFKRQKDGNWLCSIDNSYGTSLPCLSKLSW